jgi:copper(I)-binding protein
MASLMHRWLPASIGACLVAGVAHAAGGAGPVELSQPWAAPAPQGADTAVLMTLHNSGDQRDDLVRAECAGAESAEFWGPAQPGGTPTHIDGVPVQPGQTVVFSPDGIRLVLHHLAGPIAQGQTLHCTATFMHEGERLFEAAVRPDAPPPPPPI